ncbi:MAG: HDIG domain-containing protein [Armatimonadota bacterium]|nr:HDIG domain-containing protein [Armatimonadota bacterium]MDR7451256.1 HDIG domain-containing protein [Armatimonadota bacterium]MDR7466841.1 HDIG domain-containing protein [Armatimonadota bacterium]MDR7492686.1 HDIG domain-containing protein [Armatimonadota bacterium]MDR7499615.1 HDIG domain-containing protein [Armatimonadota bacterium]
MSDARAKWIASSWSRRLLIGAGTFFALTLLTGVQYLWPRSDLVAGQVSPRDIEAPRTVDYIDRAATEALRRRAAQNSQPVYAQSPEINARAQQTVARTFAAILRARAEAGADLPAGAALLRREAPVRLDEPAVMAALTLDPAQLTLARDAAAAVVERTMARGIRSGELPRAQAEARVHLRSLPVAGRALTLASAVVTSALQPNLVVDQTATQLARRRAMEAVEPVRTRILRGEIIVRRGEVVTEAHLEKLAAEGLASQPFSWLRLLGTASAVLLLLLVSYAYMRQYQPEIWSEDRLLLVWSLGVVLTVAMARIMVTRFNPYLLPSAAGTMLIAVLLRPRLALYTAALLSLLAAMTAGGDVRLGLVTFIGATVGVYAIKRISHRTDLVVAGLRVGVANALIVGAVGLADQLPVFPHLLRDAAYGLGSGVLVGMIAIGALPYLENLFGLVTPIKLLELSNPGHPLLRRLQLEAPGTYHHSIMVANLAEAAAEAVGADSLLVRVGTYYHDIGKIRRPAFFVENQVGIENPHDRMAPSLSALTVLAHVRDGLEYAREAKLPAPVAAFIPEHHGTSLITYFYHQARERGPAEEEAFRYEGPRPQSRETAIVMLADAVEGAARALPRPTPDRIAQVVRRIIREKLEDGQLDECDLTFRDLDRIAEVFTRLLASMYHPRVEYPELERDLSSRRTARSAAARQA